MPAPASSIHSTTQEFIDIYDITNDLVIMKDGSTALILTVDAMNFGLLAEEEQDAIMYAYAGLLNSLNYSIQIVIRSQTKDATNYLNLLRDQEQASTSEVKRAFIREYRDFVANLIRERNVLDKKFFIAIPATSLEMGLLPPSTVVPGVKKTDISTVERSVILDKAKNILEPKRDHLISQFGRIGLFARQLQTQEIIQLFYTSYNPEAAEGQQITDTRNYITPLVEASTTGNMDIITSTATIAPASAGVMPPADPYAGTQDLAGLLPNQPNQVDPNLVNANDIYEQPPAIVDIPLPVDTQDQLNQAAAAEYAAAPAQAQPTFTPPANVGEIPVDPAATAAFNRPISAVQAPVIPQSPPAYTQPPQPAPSYQSAPTTPAPAWNNPTVVAPFSPPPASPAMGVPSAPPAYTQQPAPQASYVPPVAPQPSYPSPTSPAAPQPAYQPAGAPLPPPTMPPIPEIR